MTSGKACRVTPDLEVVGWGDAGVFLSKSGKLYFSTFRSLLEVDFTEDKTKRCRVNVQLCSFLNSCHCVSATLSKVASKHPHRLGEAPIVLHSTDPLV